jgi:ankyrin repeat protein
MGPDPTWTSHPKAVHLAAYHGRTEAVKLLLDLGTHTRNPKSEPEIRNPTRARYPKVLRLAAYHSRTEAVKLLLDLGTYYLLLVYHSQA